MQIPVADNCKCVKNDKIASNSNGQRDVRPIAGSKVKPSAEQQSVEIHFLTPRQRMPVGVYMDSSGDS